MKHLDIFKREEDRLEKKLKRQTIQTAETKKDLAEIKLLIASAPKEIPSLTPDPK